MSKNIALIALLLPFSGQAITKEERKKEIEIKHLKVMVEGLSEWIAILANLQCIKQSFSMLPEDKKTEIKEFLKEFHEAMDEVEKEYNEVDQA